MVCPKCKSQNVITQAVSTVKTKRRGCLGWSIWLLLALFTMGLILIIPLLTNSKTKSKVRTQSVCQNCGYRWNSKVAKNKKADNDSASLHNRVEPAIVPNDSPSKVLEENKPIATAPAKVNGFPLAYHYDNVDIFVLPEFELDFTSIPLGSKVELVKEPTNEHDDKAVAVILDGSRIGYLYRGKRQDMANDFIDNNWPIISHIDSIDDEESKIGVFLGFYKNKPSEFDKLKRSGKQCHSFKLTGNANSEMQDSICVSSVGDEVTFYYEYDKEKFVASSIGDIGYVPASKTSLIEDDKDYSAFIEDISENDNGKYVVTVSVFTE